ncbi:MAG: 3-beta hydroxysteroid dehydrogenase [Alphaproteobacteria bacterium RIFCSPHIGHO2_12_FULL_63_12]|nr:MAG: 3-beta hydroxysteroid dehydrogenase [Alphaproteobacteria bacterium RIFCSPHIGHO2_12_FULL_63_12]
MKIFLTGGSGFVGGAAIKSLAPRHSIVALSRSEKSDAVLKALGAAPVRGDLETVTSEMLAGADAVLHSAAFVEEWGPWPAFEAVNVTGTERLLAAAKKAGVKRFVHVGTEAALFYGQHMRDIDETYPLAPQSPFPYSATKARAEMRVRAANDPANGFETIVIRPRLVWGEGDMTLLPAIAAMANSGKFAWVNQGRAMTSSTHIDNLVHALDLALTEGRPGEAYFVVDGPAVKFRDFLTPYMKAAGVELGEKSLPGWLVRLVADAAEPLFRLTKSASPPPVTRFAAHMMSRDCTINDAKAHAELGFRPVITVAEGLARLAG